jgi:cysteine-rich repeat protein
VLYRLDNLAAGFGENCDDGDASSGDGCSSVCTIEPGFVCSGQPGVCVVDTCRNPALDPLNDCEVDDLIEAVNLPIGVRSTRVITGGDADFFKFTVPPGVNSLVSIFDNVSGCAGNGFELEAFESGSSAGTLTLFGGCYQERFPANAALAPGTYVMRVTGRDGVPVPSYEFAVANCGDGRQEFFESCDDGNTVDGDGCSPSCQQEPDFLCTGSPSTCSQVICQTVDLTTQPGAPFLAASGTFSGNGYQPGVRANVLSTENLVFPVSVSVDVDWGASVGEIGFVGVRSSGLPVGATEEPEDSVYLRLHVGIGANQADLAVGPSPITVSTSGTMPSPQFGVYGVRMTDDGVNVSARIINLQQPGVPPLVLKTSTPVQPAPGNNRVVFGGQSVLFRNVTLCQGAP